MTAKILHLNNLSSSLHCALSDFNEKAMHSLEYCVEEGLGARTSDLEPWQLSGWFMFVPCSYLAMLDKNGVRLCVRDFNHSDYSRAWAD